MPAGLLVQRHHRIEPATEHRFQPGQARLGGDVGVGARVALQQHDPLTPSTKIGPWARRFVPRFAHQIEKQ